MSPEANPAPQESFEPTPATLAAWEARAAMLEFADSEPSSQQAELAHQLANDAFAKVVELTWDYLAHSAYRRSQGTADEVEEILQETYLRAYKGLPKFRGDASVETWLTRIMFNQLSTFYTKKAKEQSKRFEQPSTFECDSFEEMLGYLAIDTVEEPLEQVEGAESLAHLLAMINDLSPKHRKVLVLADIYNHTHEEISKLLGCSVSASKVRLSRARQALRGRIQSNQQEE